jgi:hypothetical protein
MKLPYELKIDAYSHIVPPKYGEALRKVAPKLYEQQILFSPPLYDLE